MKPVYQGKVFCLAHLLLSYYTFRYILSNTALIETQNPIICLWLKQFVL